MKPQYLRIRNWERFQHYTNRRPPWIKYHIELLDDHTLLSLPPMTQLVYDRLLLRAAVTDNNVEHDPAWLSQKFNLPAGDIQEAIETLINTGFLKMAGRKRSASKVIAKRKQNGGTETETETDKSHSFTEAAKRPVCKSCGVGGGFHVADCPELEAA